MIDINKGLSWRQDRNVKINERKGESARENLIKTKDKRKEIGVHQIEGEKAVLQFQSSISVQTATDTQDVMETV